MAGRVAEGEGDAEPARDASGLCQSSCPAHQALRWLAALGTAQV